VPGEAMDGGFKHKLTALPAKPIDKVFPDGYVTLEYTPYKLKLTIGRDGQCGEPGFAWTHFHLLLHDETKLELGPKEAIPSAGKRPEVLAFEKEILDRMAAEGGLPAAADPPRRIRLVSNLFKIAPAEMDDETGFKEYQTLWQDGPQLPIVAVVHLRDSKGQPVKLEDGPGAKALGLTQLLWDWKDVDEDVAANQSQPKPKTFIEQAIDYYEDNALPHNEKAGKVVTSKGDNCHVDRGGKRGPDARWVFPSQAGYAGKDPLDAGKFPFQVEAAKERVWASYGRGWTTGKLQGRAGILFQPSRMAGDTYKLRAYVALDRKLEHNAAAGKDEETVIVDVSTDPPRAAGNKTEPALTATPNLVKETGTFEVWREIHVSRYVRKIAAIPAFLPAHLADIQAPYAEANVQLENTMQANDQYLVADHRRSDGSTPDYNALCRNAIAGDAFLALAIDPAANHAASGATFEVLTYAAFAAAVLAHHHGNNAQAAAFMAANGANDAAEYSNTLTQLLSGLATPVIEGLSILSGHKNGAAAEARDGVTILHFDYLHSAVTAAMVVRGARVRLLNGQAVDLPDANRNRCGFVFWNAQVDTFVHEVGHHLFLPHAPFPAAKPPAGSQDERHDELDEYCMMSYNRPRVSFCGLCQLRLRGWDAGPNNALGSKLKKTGADNKKP